MRVACCLYASLDVHFVSPTPVVAAVNTATYVTEPGAKLAPQLRYAVLAGTKDLLSAAKDAEANNHRVVTK
jgi:hypothetical protein